MRFLSFLHRNKPTYGVETEEGYVSLPDLDGTLPSDLVSLIAGGEETLAQATEALRSANIKMLQEDEVALLPVIPKPGKFICLGLNFSDHAAEGGFEVPDYPALFLRASTSLIGAHAPLVRPLASETFDYEAELAVVIGREARHVSHKDALSHVFGYSIFNDASVREYQRKTHQWTAGKNFDGTGALGPVVVTADELPAGAAGLAIQSRLNGRVMQSSSLSNLIFSVADTVSLLSEIMTLQPGDVIGMGTPEGVGHARRPPVWMKPGDVCEVEIERIGVLSNPVVAEQPTEASARAAE